MLAVAAYNFKRAMRVLLCFIKTITEKLNWDNFSVKWLFKERLFNLFSVRESIADSLSQLNVSVVYWVEDE